MIIIILLGKEKVVVGCVIVVFVFFLRKLSDGWEVKKDISSFWWFGLVLEGLSINESLNEGIGLVVE